MKNIVLFGASGDLSNKKVLPALKNLKKTQDFSLYGIGRSESYTSDILDVNYISINFNNVEDFEKLKWVLNLDNPIYYLAVSSEFFYVIAENLAKRKLNFPNSYICFEKPFGKNKAEADELYGKISKLFKNICIIDHYLAKPPLIDIENIIKDNYIIKSIIESKKLNEIQFTNFENVLIGKRGEYYDKTGEIKDFFQSHTMQVISTSLKSLYNFNKLDALKNIDYTKKGIFGQYEGYLEEKGVSESSITETYFEGEFSVNIPAEKRHIKMFIRQGKAMKRKETILSFILEDNNSLVFSIAPEESISINCFLPNGKEIHLKNVIAEEYRDSYEVIFENLLNSVDGFTYNVDIKEIEQSWNISEEILKYKEHNEIFIYEKGIDSIDKGLWLTDWKLI